MNWVKLTTPSGAAFFVNLEHVAHIERAGDETLLTFAGGRPDWVHKVRETPAEIHKIALAGAQLGPA